MKRGEEKIARRDEHQKIIELSLKAYTSTAREHARLARESIPYSPAIEARVFSEPGPRLRLYSLSSKRGSRYTRRERVRRGAYRASGTTRCGGAFFVLPSG